MCVCVCCLLYLLYVHATCRRCDHDGSLTLSVHQYGEVRLSTQVQSFADEHFVARLALWSSLVCDEMVANHPTCDVAHLSRRDAGLHTTTVAAVEVPFASSTGQHLRLHYIVASSQLLSHLLSLRRRGGHLTARSGNAVLMEQVDGLILVDVEATNGLGGTGRRDGQQRREAAAGEGRHTAGEDE